MESRDFGDLGQVSALALGGGGLGQLWGPTTRGECVATARDAAGLGITLLDMAPVYGAGEAEQVVGEAFGGRLPDGMRVTTKCRLGSPALRDVAGILECSLESSLERMRLDRVDIFFLHSNVIPDDHDDSAYAARPATRWRLYEEAFLPAVERMKAAGRIGAWGITGIGMPACVLEALAGSHCPDAVQCIVNPLDSAGELRHFDGPTRAREIMAGAAAAGAAVMGIRAAAGGALADSLDRELPGGHAVRRDYDRAAGFRALAREAGMPAAALAHRYALAMDGVATVVLGVKNRDELRACAAAATAGPLKPELVARVDACFAA